MMIFKLTWLLPRSCRPWPGFKVWGWRQSTF